MNPAIRQSIPGVTQSAPILSQVQPKQVWSQMTPTQQQIVFQTLILICGEWLQQINQTKPAEGQDEPG